MEEKEWINQKKFVDSEGLWRLPEHFREKYVKRSDCEESIKRKQDL